MKTLKVIYYEKKTNKIVGGTKLHIAEDDDDITPDIQNSPIHTKRGSLKTLIDIDEVIFWNILQILDRTQNRTVKGEAKLRQ